jgi:hypothetical protein
MILLSLGRCAASVLIFAIVLSSLEAIEPSPNSFTNVSMMQVITTPDRYDGKMVKLRGYLHVRAEDTALYFTKDHADYRLKENGIWIVLRESPYSFKEQQHLDGAYVVIEGVFDMKQRGHFSAWQGGIHTVTRLEKLGSP